MGRELIRVIIYLQQEDKIMKSKMHGFIHQLTTGSGNTF